MYLFHLLLCGVRSCGVLVAVVVIGSVDATVHIPYASMDGLPYWRYAFIERRIYHAADASTDRSKGVFGAMDRVESFGNENRCERKDFRTGKRRCGKGW